VSGSETFEFAAAVAGVVVGLSAITLLAIASVFAVWQLYRRASETSLAATRASLGAEELARHVATQLMAQPRTASNGGLADLRQQAEALLDQERELQERARALLDDVSTEGPEQAALEDIERTLGRLDATMGQMAASLANVIQHLEQQQRG
jgi:hypothetical protein